MQEIIWSLTLKEIVNSKNQNILLSLIIKELASLPQNRFLFHLDCYQIYQQQLQSLLYNQKNFDLLNDYPISLKYIYQEYEKICYPNTSQLFFPNQLIAFYPNIHTYKAKKETICLFSGNTISKNQYYLSYRPLLENLNNGKSFVLKNTIKIQEEFYHNLPFNIQELESLYSNYQNSQLIDQSDIDFKEFQYRYTFSLLPLKKKK